MAPLTCVIYCRISLDKTGEGAGVERQEAECRLLAAALGREVVAVYVDNDISAMSGKRRPAFEDLLVSGAELIIVWHIDRLVRRTKELERIIDLGVPVHSVKSGYIDLSSDAGQAVAKTIVAWAEYEGRQKGTRQRSMHTQRRAQGRHWWSTAPFGRALDGGAVAEEQDVLRWAAEEIAGGQTNLMYLARLMGEAGWTGSKGAAWNQSSLRRTLLHERNVEVLGEDLWTEVREALAGRRDGTGRGPVAMLTGVCRCAVCEGPCGGTMEFNRPRYKCRRGHVAWPRDVVDRKVGAEVAAILRANREMLQAAAEDPGPELHQLALDFAAERLTAEEFTSAAERVRARAARAKPRVLADWEDMDDAHRRRVCRRLLESVVLPPRGSGQTPADPDRIVLHWRESAVGPLPPAA